MAKIIQDKLFPWTILVSPEGQRLKSLLLQVAGALPDIPQSSFQSNRRRNALQNIPPSYRIVRDSKKWYHDTNVIQITSGYGHDLLRDILSLCRGT
ncbi:hypothetical protein EDD11_009111 [Mortierella claussenii]|nr:hypothetical protein EDD11_009111 [Mortierella claussenii]